MTALLLAIVLATTCHATPVVLLKDAPIGRVNDFPSAYSGRVIVAVVVDTHGVVRAVYVKKSSGSAAYDRAVFQMARNSTYKPATQNCKPIEATYLFEEDWGTTE